MLLVLKTFLNSTPAFVPYSLRRKYPEAYEKAIRYQTKMLTTSMVVILQNISTDMMFYIQPRIGQVNGVRDMLPSPKGNDTGRYSVLVDKTEFSQVRSTIMKELPKWIKTDVPSDAMPNQDYFQGPARVKPLYDDGLSSGENSWMTQSNASFMSMNLPSEQNDDYFRASMNANRIFSYADAAAQPARTTLYDIDDTTTKASISEITGMRTEAESIQQKAIDRLTEQHKQEAVKAAQIIDAQRQEIEQLKAQRLEDIERRSQEKLATQTKAREQDDATNQLRHESVQTNLEVSALRRDMQRMMKQMMDAMATTSVNQQDNKRTNEITHDDNSPREKRRDVRSTPGKKLYFDETDLRGTTMYQDAMEADDTPNQHTHE
jgi:hypothetical protein